MHISTNLSDEDCFASRWLMFFESVLCVPKTWICPFLFGFIQQKLQFFYILKMKNVIVTGDKDLAFGCANSNSFLTLSHWWWRKNKMAFFKLDVDKNGRKQKLSGRMYPNWSIHGVWLIGPIVVLPYHLGRNSHVNVQSNRLHDKYTRYRQLSSVTTARK